MRVCNQSDRAKQLCRVYNKVKQKAINFFALREQKSAQKKRTNLKLKRGDDIAREIIIIIIIIDFARKSCSPFHLFFIFFFPGDGLGGVYVLLHYCHRYRGYRASPQVHGMPQPIPIRPRFTWNKLMESPVQNVFAFLLLRLAYFI